MILWNPSVQCCAVFLYTLEIGYEISFMLSEDIHILVQCFFAEFKRFNYVCSCLFFHTLYSVDARIWSCRGERFLSSNKEKGKTIHLFSYVSHNSRLLLHQVVLNCECWF